MPFPIGEKEPPALLRANHLELRQGYEASIFDGPFGTSGRSLRSVSFPLGLRRLVPTGVAYVVSLLFGREW